MSLTNTAIRALKPSKTTRKVSDERGLYLELSPSGGRWWRLKYRFVGKEKRLSLGVYPDVSLKEARERRDEARKLLSTGIDPSQHRKEQKLASIRSQANSFEAVTREWYEKYSPSWSESYGSRLLSRYVRCIFPYIGERPIAEITAPQLLSVIRRIEGNALDTAHRTLADCGRVFRYAIASGRANNDPTLALKGALAPRRTQHFAATTDPKALGSLLRAFDAYNGTLPVACALRLQPLLFVRPGELRTAEWSDIDLNTAQWRFSMAKKKRTDHAGHIVPLSRQAVSILRQIKPLTGKGRYVFPSARSNQRPMSDNAVLAAMRRLDIAKEEQTGHGFRAIARTILDEVLGFPPHIIEHQLGHSVRDPLGRAYNRTTHLAERKAMMQKWADYLDEVKLTSDVVPIRQRA